MSFVLALILSTTSVQAQELPPDLAPTQYPRFVSYEEANGRDLTRYGYHEGRKVSKGLIIGGASVFGSIYLLTTFSGSVAAELETDKAGQWSFLPVFGPIVWAATPGGDGATDYLLGLSAVSQAAGLTMVGFGIKGKEGWVRNADIQFRPVVSPDGAGVQATGSF
jgi:hypothetical protein